MNAPCSLARQRSQRIFALRAKMRRRAIAAAALQLAINAVGYAMGSLAIALAIIAAI